MITKDREVALIHVKHSSQLTTDEVDVHRIFMMAWPELERERDRQRKRF
jgi:hypothetical protein